MPVRVSIAALSLILSAAPLRADPIPPSIAGKSIVVNWTDIRTEKRGADITTTPTQNFTIKIYVGSKGDIFSLYDRRSVNKKGKINVDKQVAGLGSNNAREGTVQLSWRFERGELTSDQIFTKGARRVSIAFSGGMTACAVQVIYGKAADNQNIRYLSRIDGQEVEMLSSKITSTNCQIVEGNILQE